MRRVVLCLLFVACGKGSSERATAPAGSGSAVAIDAAVPEPVVPRDSKALPAPPRTPSPQLTLVGCGPAPEPPVMRVGDPDIPGAIDGYHEGAPPDTPYTRLPFGLAQQPLAKPYISVTLNTDRPDISDAIEKVLAPHEDKLLACYAKALADPTMDQHEMNVMWQGRQLEVTLRDDIKNPHLGAEETECVAKILRTIKLPPKVQRAVNDAVVWLFAHRLQEVKQPPKKKKLPPEVEGEMNGGFGYGFSGPGPAGHGTRATYPGWTGYRIFFDDDGAALAPIAVATITPLLPTIAACLAKLDPAPLTGSLRGLVTIDGGPGGPSLLAEVTGLGDHESERCFWDSLRDTKIAGSVPTTDRRRLLCDFTWGDPQPLRATEKVFHDVMRVHATDIEYFDVRYLPEDDLPYRRYPIDSMLIVADVDAPGAFINAALHFAGGLRNVMVAVKADTGPPFFVGRAAEPGHAILPGAHVGFQRSAGKTTRCDEPCKAHTPCAGAWIGVGDDNIGADLLVLRAATEKAGYNAAAVGRRSCK